MNNNFLLILLGLALTFVSCSLLQSSEREYKSRVVLCDNIIAVNGAWKNVLTQDMVYGKNVVFIIKHDYDLNGRTITIPANCVLEFNGGSLSNGRIQCKEGNTIEVINKHDNLIFKNVIIQTASSGYGLNWKIKGVAKSSWFSIDNNILYNARAFDGLVLESDVEVTDCNVGFSYNELWARDKDYLIKGNGHVIRIHNGNKERQEAFIRCFGGTLTLKDVSIEMDANNMYSAVQGNSLIIDNCTIKSSNRCLTGSPLENGINWEIKNSELYSKTFVVEATACKIDEVLFEGCVIDDVYDGRAITFGFDKISIGNNNDINYGGKVVMRSTKFVGGIESVRLEEVLLDDCELGFPSIGSRGDNLQSNIIIYRNCRFVGFPAGLTMRNGFHNYISCFNHVIMQDCTFDIKNYEDFYDGGLSHGCLSFRKVGEVRLLNNRFKAAAIKDRNWFNSDIDFVECENVELSGNTFEGGSDAFYRMHVDFGTKVVTRRKNLSTAKHFLLGTKNGSGLQTDRKLIETVVSDSKASR